MAAYSTKVKKKKASEMIDFSIDGQVMPVTLKWSDRRRTIQLSINQEQQIIVHAPRKVPKTEIQDILENRLGWIKKSLKKVETSAANRFDPKWVDGEIHYYLGQSYPLKIQSGDRPKFELENEAFSVCVDQPDDIHKIQFLKFYSRKNLKN